MSELPTSNNGNGDNEERPPGMPRWVKVTVVIAIVLVGLFVIMHLLSGNMGSMRHMHTGSLEQGEKKLCS